MTALNGGRGATGKEMGAGGGRGAHRAESNYSRGVRATQGLEGACFFELGAGTAAMVAGRFLADPPDVHLSEPGPEHLAAKRAFEVDRLRSWFGR